MFVKLIKFILILAASSLTGFLSARYFLPLPKEQPVILNKTEKIIISEEKGIVEIIKKIQRSLKKDWIFYLVVLSVKDPVFKWCKEKLKTVEKNTFYLPKFTTFRHFFSKKELLDIFKNFRIIKIKEEKMKDTHGGIHYHYLIRIIVKK